MDISTFIGLFMGIGLVLWAMLSKGTVAMFLDPPSVAIVVGGTIATAMISFPLKQLLSIARVVRNAFFTKPADPIALIKDLVKYAEVARRDGILSLEGMTRDSDNTFLVGGIQMAVDGSDPELIEQVLVSEVESVADRHASGKALLDNMAKFAPAFGMIGTLVGLVLMLAQMDNPDAIGPGMAVALLTTLYGSMLANMVFMPLGDKLALRSNEEILLMTIATRGVMSIQSGDNPRIVEQKLKIFLPPALRSSEDEDAD
jgi:chemotaxis protein MotA